MRDLVAKAAVAIVGLAAVARAATAPPPPSGRPITEAEAHAVYHDAVSHERGDRRQAAIAFPGDVWSQDDDFHRRENDAVRQFASKHDVRIADVLRALDDGMHAGWPAPGRPVATVPPCRPRLAY